VVAKPDTTPFTAHGRLHARNTLPPPASRAASQGGAFPDGVTPGNLKQRRIRFARLEFGDFVDAFTPARIVGNRQKWDVGLHGHPVFPLEGEGPVVSPVTHRYDPRTARAFGLDAGDGADSKVLACLMLRGATDLRLPSRVTVLNPHGLRPILHRLRGRRMRDLRNPRAVFQVIRVRATGSKTMKLTKLSGCSSARTCRGLLRFGISAALRVASLFYGKSAGDGGSVDEYLNDRGDEAEGPGNDPRQRTADVRNLTGAASHRLGQEAADVASRRTVCAERDREICIGYLRS
jgi:hypothetical protein